MRVGDFFVLVPDPGAWDSSSEIEQLDEELIERIAQGPIAEAPDIEVAVALARLAHEEFQGYGTGGDHRITDEQSGLVIRALKAVLRRLNIDSFNPPFRNFSTFYSHWRRVGASGSGGWQARRDILDEDFEPLHQLLDEREAGSIASSLADPISPRGSTGWSKVDEEISELRRHFESASTEQDYRNVGNDCVAVLEALSAAAYDHALHGPEGTDEPPIPSTKERLNRYIEAVLPGSANAELRKLARASIELAQAVKHRASGDRTAAGVAADSVIMLSNLLRRIDPTT